jgi:hypothetical protein
MNPAQHSLLAKGASSYVDALTAMDAFEQEVERICRAEYERHESALKAAMGISDSVKCGSYRNARRLADREAGCGVRRPAEPYYYFYVYLHWTEPTPEQPEVRAEVCLELSSKKRRDDIAKRIRQVKPKSRVRDDVGSWPNLALGETLQAVEPGAASKALGGLLEEWIDCCKAIGGLGLQPIPTPAADRETL